MMARMIKGAAVSALVSLTAACASLGGDQPSAPRASGSGAASIAAAVDDPAPIVSGTMRAYEVRGRRYVPQEQPHYDEVGLASWYGDQFNGRPTATGEIFDMHALTAAHKTLPLPGLIEVTNLANGRQVVLRVNDRGPFVDNRILDLSRGAAEELGMLQRGVGEVRVRYLGRAPRLGGGRRLQQASVATPAPQAERRAARQFWVQAGAFADDGAARRSAETLGRSARVEPTRDGRRLFRVMMGPWPDANAAERARQAAIAYGYVDALLISGG